MARKIISRPGLGGYTYYYEDGRYIGKSRPGLLPDTEVFFDAEGNRTGTSYPGLFDRQHIVLEDAFTSPEEKPVEPSADGVGCLACVLLLGVAILLFHACGKII